MVYEKVGPVLSGALEKYFGDIGKKHQIAPLRANQLTSISFDLATILGPENLRFTEAEVHELLSRNYAKTHGYLAARLEFDQKALNLYSMDSTMPSTYGSSVAKLREYVKSEDLPLEIKQAVNNALKDLVKEGKPRQSHRVRRRFTELQSEITLLEILLEEIKPIEEKDKTI